MHILFSFRDEVSLLHVFFKNEFIVQYKRDQLYGIEDLVCKSRFVILSTQCAQTGFDPPNFQSFRDTNFQVGIPYPRECNPGVLLIFWVFWPRTVVYFGEKSAKITVFLADFSPKMTKVRPKYVAWGCIQDGVKLYSRGYGSSYSLGQYLPRYEVSKNSFRNFLMELCEIFFWKVPKNDDRNRVYISWWCII